MIVHVQDQFVRSIAIEALAHDRNKLCYSQTNHSDVILWLSYSIRLMNNFVVVSVCSMFEYAISVNHLKP